MKMISVQIMALAAIVGSLLLMMSSGPYELDAAEMANVSGGDWCSNPTLDLAGIDCNECTSNGNGGSIKCSANVLDWKELHVIGQAPAQYWSYPEYSCSGTANEYEGSDDCTGEYSTKQCYRTHTGGSFGGMSYVVICN